MKSMKRVPRKSLKLTEVRAFRHSGTPRAGNSSLGVAGCGRHWQAPPQATFAQRVWRACAFGGLFCMAAATRHSQGARTRRERSSPLCSLFASAVPFFHHEAR